MKKSCNSLTLEERKLIEKYRKKNFSCAEIARIIGRSKNGVVVEVRRFGKEVYIAKEAQLLADTNLKDKYARLSERNRKMAKPERQNNETRFANLEMQVEILADTIKELMNK